MEAKKDGVMAKVGALLFCLLLLVPSYFINNGTSHDWGGDFAMYISQAENIAAGTDQAENGYIYNAQCPGVGPPTYPVGFPLLLSPILAFTGNDMEYLIDFLAIIFILFGLMTFMFLRERTGFLLAIIGALTLAYHPALLVFKREVMSDVPFVLFTLLSLYLAAKKKWVWAGLFMAFCASIRTVGVSLILASIILLILDVLKSTSADRIKGTRYAGIALALAGYFLINHWLFSTSSESGYKNVFALYDFQETISGNIDLYWNYTQQFLFTQTEGWLAGVPFLTLVSLSVLGWLRQSRTSIGLAEIWLPIYLIVLAVYPYRGGAMRFILPALPFLFYYSGIAVQESSFILRPLVLVLLCIPAGLNAERTIAFSKNWPEHVSGPQSLASVDLFNHIKNNVPEDESVLFLKPRVLALYTGRNSMSNERYQTPFSIKNQLDTIPIQHLLTCKEIRNPGIDSVLVAYPDLMLLEFENSDFKLYRYISDK